MKVAVVHYWWVTNRGGEAVVSALVELFPNADIFVHVCDEKLVRKTLGPSFTGEITGTFISRFPGAKRHYQKYLPFMPLALENLDLTSYDLVISSESGPAKGVVTRPDALHICYCHSPMRYIWDMYHEYLSNAGWFVRTFFPIFAHWLRLWDRVSAERVDRFIANSSFVASRIRKFYRRDSDVIFPPVNVTKFDPSRPRENFYLCLGQLVGYKRVDIAISAFNQMGIPLVVIGEGELLGQFQRMVAPNVSLLGWQDYSIVKDHLERCRALIFPGVEDFGIVPVEAMASGAPVIGFARGGVLDTVIDGKTGVLFNEQTADALISAVDKVESGEVRFDSSYLHAHALKYDKSIFIDKISQAINEALGRLVPGSVGDVTARS